MSMEPVKVAAAVHVCCCFRQDEACVGFGERRAAASARVSSGVRCATSRNQRTHRAAVVHAEREPDVAQTRQANITESHLGTWFNEIRITGNLCLAIRVYLSLFCHFGF